MLLFEFFLLEFVYRYDFEGVDLIVWEEEYNNIFFDLKLIYIDVNYYLFVSEWFCFVKEEYIDKDYVLYIWLVRYGYELFSCKYELWLIIMVEMMGGKWCFWFRQKVGVQFFGKLC